LQVNLADITSSVYTFNLSVSDGKFINTTPARVYKLTDAQTAILVAQIPVERISQTHLTQLERVLSTTAGVDVRVLVISPHLDDNQQPLTNL
jgi:hypothetical protein